MKTTPADTELLETMLCRHGRELPLLGRHLLRLKAAADALGFEWPGQANIERAIRQVVSEKANGQGDWRVRLLVSRQGEIRVQAYPLQSPGTAPCVAVAPDRLRSDEPLLRFKTTYRPWYASATAWLAEHPGYFDLLFANEHGALCEGSRSNVYVFRDGAWRTPPVSAGLLGGVMRSQLLESGRAVESDLTTDDLLRPGAQIRLSNGLRGWFDVRLCQTAGDGAQGTSATPPG